MAAINEVGDLTIEGEVGVLTLNSPPVNALSAPVRTAINDGIKAAMENPDVKAIVLICDGKTFIAGADITEFGKAPKGPSLFDAQAMIENAPKPVIAAIHGTALGGGLEVALTCHYRVAVPSAKCGLPEVNLGLLPGAGGTQRLPRIVGPEKALEMMTAGSHVGAKACKEMGLVDELVEEGKLREGAIAFANKLVAEKRPLKKVRDLNEKVEAARGHPEIFANFRKANARKFRGFLAPEYNIQCIEAAVNLPFDDGIKVEQKLFRELVTGTQSAAQRHVFFAERQVWKLPDVPADTPTIPVNRVGVIGAGTMGGGISMNFLNAGIPVTIVETKQEALDRGLATIRRNYENTAKKGRMTQEDVEKRMSLLKGSLALEDLADSDLVIEAVFENMEIKKDVFGKLDRIVKQGAILATNTSALNIDEIATAVKRPEAVIGLHFFSPANVMKLLEVVRADKTSKPVIATSMQLAPRRSARSRPLSASAPASSATASSPSVSARRRSSFSKARCLGMSTVSSTISVSRWAPSPCRTLPVSTSAGRRRSRRAKRSVTSSARWIAAARRRERVTTITTRTATRSPRLSSRRSFSITPRRKASTAARSRIRKSSSVAFIRW